jgi:prepilin-type N-terminal cleavage/methylation domain-containing protein
MRRTRHAAGFTLVEILIVVIILGVLAGLIIPQMAGASSEAARSAFVVELKRYAEAAEVYRVREGVYVEDTSSGEYPAGWDDDYADRESYVDGTPIGGVWDFELDSFEVTSAFGVHFDGTGNTQDDDYMTLVDEYFDDGDLETGLFRKIANNRFYYIIAN